MWYFPISVSVPCAEVDYSRPHLAFMVCSSAPHTAVGTREISYSAQQKGFATVMFVIPRAFRFAHSTLQRLPTLPKEWELAAFTWQLAAHRDSKGG